MDQPGLSHTCVPEEAEAADANRAYYSGLFRLGANISFVGTLAGGEVQPRTLRPIDELKAQGYPDLIAVKQRA